MVRSKDGDRATPVPQRATVTAPPGPDPSGVIREIAAGYGSIEIMALRRRRWFLLGQKVSIEFHGNAEEVRRFREDLRDWARASGGLRGDQPIL